MPAGSVSGEDALPGWQTATSWPPPAAFPPRVGVEASLSPSRGHQCHPVPSGQGPALATSFNLSPSPDAATLGRWGFFGRETEGRRRGHSGVPSWLPRGGPSELWHRVGRDCHRFCTQHVPRTRGKGQAGSPGSAAEAGIYPTATVTGSHPTSGDSAPRGHLGICGGHPWSSH